MKKIFLSSSVIVLFTLYVLATMTSNVNVSQPPAIIQEKKDSNQTPLIDPTILASTQPAPTPISQTAPSNPPPAPTPVIPTPPPVSQGQYKNGEFTGSPGDAYYGYVQVKAITKNGKLSDVQFLSYPNDRQNSIRISQYATPLLISEAIQAQSANVDAISGATFTSMAFQQSLASALDQARN